jgi:hypothetical protein
MRLDREIDMQKELHTTIDIDASPEQVWAVLADFERYGEWNPFVTAIQGSPTPGLRLRVRLTPPGARGVTMKPRVTVVEPGRTFEWLGSIVVRGIFDGRHRFELEATERGTRFTQCEAFSGVLVPLLPRSFHARTAAGFVAMNDALKARVEQAVVPNA